MENQPKIQRLALAITRWIGSPTSIIVHTALFIMSFGVSIFGLVPFNEMFLTLTTIVSLEAIYLSLFIQMTVNYTTASIKEVGEDIEEIQEDVGEIQEDMGEIQEDIEEISEDVDELQEDVEEISEDVGEISEDVEEISEDDAAHEAHTTRQQEALAAIQADLKRLMEDIERLKKSNKINSTQALALRNNGLFIGFEML